MLKELEALQMEIVLPKDRSYMVAPPDNFPFGGEC